MKIQALIAAAALAGLLGACSHDSRIGVIGGVGAVGLASDAMLKPDYLSAALLAYAIYDPAAPNWEIHVQPLDEERVRMNLQFRSLASGGEGEARTVFMRNARQLVDEGGFAGFEILRYEEGIESRRPFARRYATGEIRLARHLAAAAM